MIVVGNFVTARRRSSTLPFMEVRRGRGRPATDRAEPKNRLRELRDRRGLTQEALGALTGLSQQQIGNLERDDRRMTFDYAQRLAPHLDADPADLMPTMRSSVASVLAIALDEAENRPDSFDLPAPPQRLQAPSRLLHPEDCFAAEIFDHSADLLYPAGSTVIARRLDTLEEPLRPGTKIIVRRFIGSRAEAQTHEVLAGLLDRSVTGDLMLLTRSSNPRVPPSVLIQRGTTARRGLADRQATFRLQDDTIDYVPRPEDPGEILGRIEYAITPE